MKRILHLHSAPREYHCDALVVCCFDHRFDRVTRKFLRRIHIHDPDVVVVAGGAKSLATPEHDSDRDFILAQVAKSIRLHGTNRVILMLHSDCGAYGGLKAFNGDEAQESVHHRDELRHAYRVVNAAFPAVTIEGYFVDFAGVWQLETAVLQNPNP